MIHAKPPRCFYVMPACSWHPELLSLKLDTSLRACWHDMGTQSREIEIIVMPLPNQLVNPQSLQSPLKYELNYRLSPALHAELWEHSHES